MTWEPGRVTYSSSTGAAPVTWSYTGRDVPRPGGCVTPRTNLWLYRGSSPAAEQSVTVSRFRYQAVP